MYVKIVLTMLSEKGLKVYAKSVEPCERDQFTQVYIGENLLPIRNFL